MNISWLKLDINVMCMYLSRKKQRSHKGTDPFLALILTPWQKKSKSYGSTENTRTRPAVPNSHDSTSCTWRRVRTKVSRSQVSEVREKWLHVQCNAMYTVPGLMWSCVFSGIWGLQVPVKRQQMLWARDARKLWTHTDVCTHFILLKYRATVLG